MTTLLDLFDADRENFTYAAGPYIREHNNNRHKHVLKSKENIFKLKLCKSLKRKLKKYKLRRDGNEDPDVLDVSKIFLTTLNIKSQLSITDSSENNDDVFVRPKNYLFNMGRRKTNFKGENTLKECLKVQNIDCLSRDSLIENAQASQEACALSDAANQAKKQKNAFQLMMNSRNKSLGTNSPGKDKVIDSSDGQDVVEQKNVKVKRNLMLQKMAEAKGALKNKEYEHQQDEYIKNKMDERATKLKQMINKTDKSSRKIKKQDKIFNQLKSISPNSPTKEKKFTRNLQVIDIFDEPDDNSIKENSNKHVDTEDEEFLKKLAPSIRKKENMLCYFKKIEKECDSSLDIHDSPCDKNPNILKVKFTPKNKKRKKKKLSLNKINDDCPEIVKDNSITSKNDSHEDEKTEKNVEKTQFLKAERTKRKRKYNSDLPLKVNKDISEFDTSINDRPKRNIKKPTKYSDEIEDFSDSEEEYHIFTPKKKKHLAKTEPKLDCIELTGSDVSNDSMVNEIKLKNKNVTNLDKKSIEKSASYQKKATKLAPIFASKVQDVAALEAKQKFLQSGVPEQLKKIIAKQQTKVNISSDFPTVVHIQQIMHGINNPKQNILSMVTNNSESDNETEIDYHSTNFSKLIDDKVVDKKIHFQLPISDIKTTLENMKQAYPKFPVYRTFRLLKDRSKGNFSDCTFSNLDNSIEVVNGILENMKNEDPDNLIWTEKYKAMTTCQVIGNFNSIKELKKWLVSWRESEITSKAKGGAQSDSSDFCISDVDTDSRDSERSINNLLILTGPVGCGKTSTVYAAAAELAIKVIEVNVSSRRTGKIMLQDLQEATQSHKVNRSKGTSSVENSQNSQNLQETIDVSKVVKKRGRPKKTVEKPLKASQTPSLNDLKKCSQDSTRTGMSLILIDDADIVFDQDDGFCSAVMQLAQCSKRPVILVTASLTCQHLQKFVHLGKVIKLQPLLPRLLGTWLDLMCLADTGQCFPGISEKILDYFKGDIRKTINYLHFYIQAFVNTNTKPKASLEISEDYKFVDDENSSMSWTDTGNLDFKPNLVVDNSNMDSVWSFFMENEMRYHSTCFREIDKIYWSIPNLLQGNDEKINKTCSKNQKVASELEVMSKVMDSFSLVDYYSRAIPEVQRDLLSHPFYSRETANVTENENMYCYSKHINTSNDIFRTLVNTSILGAQDILKNENNLSLPCAGLVFQRARDKVISRHQNLSGLYPSAVMDRRSLTLDYWSYCRNICAIEKNKTDGNSKRKNRYSHYLKTSKIMPRTESFDKLAESLSFSRTTN